MISHLFHLLNETVRDERMSQLWLSKVTYYEDLMT